MSDVSPREALECEKARLLEEAEVKAREAADATTRAAQIERDLAELDRIAAKYNLTVRVPAKQFAHGTVGALADVYRHDGRSPYKKLRFKTRAFYDSSIKVILEICGDRRLSELKTHDIQKIYDDYTEGRTKRMMMAHSVMTMLRGLINFGATTLNDKDCELLAVLLHHMHFPWRDPRSNI